MRLAASDSGISQFKSTTILLPHQDNVAPRFELRVEDSRPDDSTSGGGKPCPLLCGAVPKRRASFDEGVEFNLADLGDRHGTAQI
jgi:hypothetical protein